MAACDSQLFTSQLGIIALAVELHVLNPVCMFSSFQFETEIEGGKLRRDVFAEGGVSSGGSPTGIISMLSGQEELFAFRRAVSSPYILLLLHALLVVNSYNSANVFALS